MIKKYLIILLLPIFPAFFIGNAIAGIGYSDYKDILSALLNISSIVFAIIGAWIAIVYPTAIGRVFNGPVSDNSFKAAAEDSGYLAELVETVMVSAFVLMMVLSIQFVVPVFKNVFPSGHLYELKIFGFYVVTSMTLAQLHVVFRVILANYYFLNQLRQKNINEQINALHK